MPSISDFFVECNPNTGSPVGRNSSPDQSFNATSTDEIRRMAEKVGRDADFFPFGRQSSDFSFAKELAFFLHELVFFVPLQNESIFLAVLKLFLRRFRLQM